MPRTTGAAQDPSRSGEDIDTNAIRLPDGFALADAGFVKTGSDLLVSGADGVDVLLRGFFAGEAPPDLISPNGVHVAGRLVATLAGGEAPVQLAEALFGAGASPIGAVATVNGTLNVIRADGTRDTLEAGDPVYPRDILETDPDSTASISVGDETIFSLGSGGRMILSPGGPDQAPPGEPVLLAAGPGEYAFACGVDSRSMIVDTPVGQIHATAEANLVLTYLEVGGLRVILIPGADGSVGDAWIENEAGSLHMTLAYQLVLVEGAAMVPELKGLLDSDDIIAGYGQVLGSLPSACDTNPIVAAARMYELETADLAGDSGDLSEEDLQALVEFETEAGDETTGDATFADAKVVVTQHDALAGEGAETPTVQPVVANTWTRPPSDTGSADGGAGNSNETLINNRLTGGEQQRPTFADPPGVRPPIVENLAVTDWDPGLRQWKVLVPQEPTEYAKTDFYKTVEQYDEPEPFVFLPLSPDDIGTQYFPTSGDTMILMSAGPLSGAQESGRGVETGDLFFEVPGNMLPRDSDGSRPVDAAGMKSANALRIDAGDTVTISFDWALDARDEEAFNDYAVFIVNGEWFKLSDIRSTGAFGSSGWRKSEFAYTATNVKDLTLGFAVINDADDANEPRLLIDNVRLNEPVPAAYRDIGDAPAERGGTPLPGEVAFRTFALPPSAEPDAISTSENIARNLFVTDLVANDDDPNALDGLSVTGLNDSGALGTVTFSGPDTIV